MHHSSRPQLPVYGRDQDRPIRRHHSASYYAHRVKESLTTRVSKLICSVFLGLLAIVGLITFILWLSLRPHRPRIFLNDFSVPALGHGGGGPENAQINFRVTARNSNQGIGIYYDASQVTVYYGDKSIGGYPVLTPFYQQPKNSTQFASVLSGSSLTLTESQWKQMQNDRSRGPVIFRLEFTSTIRFKISLWNSKRHRMHANCPVGLGQDGLLLPVYMDKRCAVYFD